jgi:hypothetical protein
VGTVRPAMASSSQDSPESEAHPVVKSGDGRPPLGHGCLIVDTRIYLKSEKKEWADERIIEEMPRSACFFTLPITG